MDRASPDGQVDVGVGHDAGEPLGDPRQLDGGWFGGWFGGVTLGDKTMFVHQRSSAKCDNGGEPIGVPAAVREIRLPVLVGTVIFPSMICAL